MVSVTLKYFIQKRKKKKDETNTAKCQQSLNLSDEFMGVHNTSLSTFVYVRKFS